MERKIKIEFERGGTFEAIMLEEEAPETTNVVWNSLPVEFPIKHAGWSGQVIFGFVDKKFNIVENPKRILQPGDITFDPHFLPTGPANKRTPNEIIIAYGYKNLIYASVGYPKMVNHFATITKGDLNELAEIGTRIREKGMEKVSIRKA